MYLYWTVSWKEEDKISVSQALVCISLWDIHRHRGSRLGLNFNVYGEAWSDVGSILYTLLPLTHSPHPPAQDVVSKVGLCLTARTL